MTPKVPVESFNESRSSGCERMLVKSLPRPTPAPLALESDGPKDIPAMAIGSSFRPQFATLESKMRTTDNPPSSLDCIELPRHKRCMLRFSLAALVSLATALALSAATVALDGRTFTLPDGFTVERVTTTHQVLRPVNACFDDQGRLYVTDSSGSSQAPAEQAADPRWRVVRLEDTDHDGVFDKSTVFADHLPMLQGILWHQGVVYIGGTPAIWKLIDKDGDGHADERVEWWNVGRPSTHCGNEVHGPYGGPDGFIYWTKGAFEPIAWTNGITGQAHLDRGAHIFRARPDGSQMDSIMTGGMDNPVEVAFTADGECLFTSTFIDFSQPEFRDGLAHAIYGGVYGKLNSNIEDRAVKRTSPEVLHPFVQFGAAAPSGLCRYTLDSFGPGYRDNFFASLFNKHKITRHQLRRTGATFAAETTDFLATEDSDFHPTDVLQDPDGSLIVADTGGWYKLCCPTSQLWKPDVLGCLYRVKRMGAPIATAKSTPTAHDVIVHQGSTANWQERIVAAAGEPFAVHSIIEALIRTASASELREGLKQPAIPVKRAALIALSELDGSDLKLEDVIPYLSASQAELSATAEWVLRRRSDWSAALAAWAKLEFPSWAKAGKVDQVKPLLPLFTHDTLGQDLIAESARNPAYPLSLRHAAFEAMGSSGLKETPASWRSAVSQTLVAPGAGSEAAANSDYHALLSAALRVANQIKETKGQESRMAGFRELAADSKAPLDLRLQSLASRPSGSALSADEFQMARTHLQSEVAPPLRSASVRTLTRAGLSVDQLGDLADTLKEVGPLELNPLVGVYENQTESAVGARLIAALKNAKARSSLRADLLKACLAKLPMDVRKEGEALLAQLVPDNSKQVERIDSLLAELKPLHTDIRRGQGVFNSTKAACVQCHRIGYAGGDLGPNLTAVGEVRTVRDLLEAVVYPSASLVRSYEPVVITTRDGELHTGIVRDESDLQVRLVTGPGAEQRLAKSDIIEQRPSAVSIMPAGLDEQLTRQELGDLVAFLKNTHWGAK